MSVVKFTEPERFLLHCEMRARELAMRAEPCSLVDLVPDWVVGEEEGVHRPDGKFFQVSGVNIVEAAGREISGWKQPMIMGDGNGTIVLIANKRHESTIPGEPMLILVRIKAEPGNNGVSVDGRNTRVLVAPTLQFSESNFTQHERAKRGEKDDAGNPIKPIPLADLALDDHIQWQQAHGDGGRFLDKTNRMALLLMGEGRIQEAFADAKMAPTDFAWVSKDVLRAIFRDGLANAHLREAASLLI